MFGYRVSAGFGLRASGFGGYYLTEMCSGSETGSYLRLIDFVYDSTLGLRVIKKKKKLREGLERVDVFGLRGSEAGSYLRLIDFLVTQL